MWVGNYTDPRVGFGFNYDKLNVALRRVSFLRAW